MDALDRIVPPPRCGERLAVRYRLPDGSATDVVGWLERVDAVAVAVRDHQGRPVSVDRSTIVAARRVPAARGGRDPLRTSAEELERIALPGWVAHIERLGEWTMRAAGGFTGRANSCLAVGDPGLPLDQAAERVTAFSSAHGIRPLVQVIAHSEPEQGLRALGWRETYVPTDVLATRLADLLEDTVPDPRVQVWEDLEPVWLDAYRRSRPSSASPEVLHQILGEGRPFGLAGVPDGDVLIAIGRGHVSQDWLGLASLWTAPEHRRRGWADTVITTLGHWAARRGARNVYLQVAQENESAHRAYQRRGFRLHHSYRYLAPGP